MRALGVGGNKIAASFASLSSRKDGCWAVWVLRTLIAGKTQKQGQSRLRSFLASQGTVPGFGLAFSCSSAPQSTFSGVCNFFGLRA